ncbi:cation efflux family protein [Ectocarpus siliculosus]|uniref:Cation efflux family protein n=1 Tax=Ectocarpus siliculosus TaxID=2880 RepID=D7FQH9_ECTSI|nr:cation efflux family protein [Ectocarpus siliculosus]|eukprot:CBJ30574.1 cation efflux family protein [Ectocarpus siliculosus]
MGSHAHDHSHASGLHCHDHGQHAAEKGAVHAIAMEESEDHNDRYAYDHHDDGRRHHDGNGGAAAGAGQKTTNSAESAANQRKLKQATAFVLVFFVVEVIGGVWSGSLAIISDAAHLLADVSGFVLAMVANEIASRPACDKLTYGPVRAEVLSALFSTVTIVVLSLLLLYSALARIVDFSKGQGEEIDGRMMTFIAALGLLVNVALLSIFGHEHGGHDHSHGHGHGHAHAHDDHDEEEGLVVPATLRAGVGERASLVNNHCVNSNSSTTNNGSGDAGLPLDISSSSSGASSMAGGQDVYGSLAVGDGGGTAALGGLGTGVDRFPEVRAGVGEEVVKLKKEKNINMEAAVLHAVTDLVQSAGVLLAGLLIWYDLRWKWADPIATLFFVGLVLNSTRWLLKRAFNVLLEGVPDSIDYDQLRRRLSSIEGVTDLHCLHVWSLTLGRTVVSAHIKATDPEKALVSAHGICEAMGVVHSTIQVQVDHCVDSRCKHPCVSAVGGCCGPTAISARPAPQCALSASRATSAP